jgi:hypothetical protein
MAVTTAAYPKTNRGIQGNQRITLNLDTTSTPLITTIIRLRLGSPVAFYSTPYKYGATNLQVRLDLAHH